MDTYKIIKQADHGQRKRTCSKITIIILVTMLLLQTSLVIWLWATNRIVTHTNMDTVNKVSGLSSYLVTYAVGMLK